MRFQKQAKKKRKKYSFSVFQRGEASQESAKNVRTMEKQAKRRQRKRLAPAGLDFSFQ